MISWLIGPIVVVASILLVCAGYTVFGFIKGEKL